MESEEGKCGVMAEKLFKSTESYFPGRWWEAIDEDRVRCFLCPRDCKLRDGQRGFCFVRQNIGGAIVLTSYGRSSGFCVDPIEKKPLNHFYPGSSVLSFGTAGCNLGCRFCQNWDISKSREIDRLAESATPETIFRMIAPGSTGALPPSPRVPRDPVPASRI